MNHLEDMLERNKSFAAQQSASGTLMPSLPREMPSVKAIIIGCADMRVDPAHVLEIKPAVVLLAQTLVQPVLQLPPVCGLESHLPTGFQ